MTINSQPTRIRYLVIGSSSLMAVLLYFDRFCISIAEIYIQQDLGLSSREIGWMLSAFFWTYALAQVPSGWMTDKFGSRTMLTIYILLWSLFTGLTGAAGSFIAILFVRFGFGLSQAGAYPTAASIVSKWVPLSARGFSSGVVAVGGRIGGFLAFSLTGYVLIWMTPSTTPTQIEVGDILDESQFVSELLEPPKEPSIEYPVRVKYFSTFSPEAKTAVRSAFTLSKNRSTEDAGQGEFVAGLFSSVEKQLVATELSRVIATVGFFDPAELRGLALEKEAQLMLEKPLSELNEQESERLNRLVLESLHRQSIKRLYVAGWRPMMMIYGSLGLLVAAVVWFATRDTPKRHPHCNELEQELIESGRSTQSSGQIKGVPLKALLKSFSMWLCCMSQWFTNIGWVFLMTWAPRYFSTVHKVSVVELSLMVSIPPLVGWFGMMTGGATTDRLVKLVGVRWGRALPMSLSRFVAMFAYLACMTAPSPWFAVVMFSIVAFATDFGSTAVWAFNQDVGGRYVGSVLGWGNMWGNIGAAVAPMLMIEIVGTAERWDLAFMACAGAFLLAGIASAGVNATIPIVSDSE